MAIKRFINAFDKIYLAQAFGGAFILLSIILGYIAISSPKDIKNSYDHLDELQMEIDWDGYPRHFLSKALLRSERPLTLHKSSLNTPKDGHGDAYKRPFYMNKRPLSVQQSNFLAQSISNKASSYHNSESPQLSQNQGEEEQAPGQGKESDLHQDELAITPAAPNISTISIMVLDYCLSSKQSQDVLNRLDENVSLSINPYCKDPGQAVDMARKFGHEVFVGVPMEISNQKNIDLGPLTLTSTSSAKANLDRLQQALSLSKHVVGIAAYNNPSFTRSNDDFTPVMEYLSQKGYGLFTTNLSPKTYIKTYAQATKLPFGYTDIYIDERLSPTDIQLRLSDLARIAKERGHAIGIMRPSHLAVSQLSQWLQDIRQQNLMLIPVSAQMQHP